MSAGEPTMDRASHADLVATACRILGNLDITREAFGHVSFREPGAETMLIKGKGPNEVGLRYTTAADIVEVDFAANVVESAEGLRAPSESYIHIWMYKQNPDLRSVIHVHPEYAVLLTICGIDVRPIYGVFGMGSRIAMKGVPVYPRSITVDNDNLGREFAEFVGSNEVALMRGHGITVVGSGVEAATVRAIAFNELSEMTYKAHVLGTPQLIADDEIELLRKPLDPNRPRGTAGGTATVMATWNYYVSLAGDIRGQ